MKVLVEFARPNAKPVMIAPDHVSMLEPTLEGNGTRVWLVGWSRPVIVEHGVTEVWSMLWHAELLKHHGG